MSSSPSSPSSSSSSILSACWHPREWPKTGYIKAPSSLSSVSSAICRHSREWSKAVFSALGKVSLRLTTVDVRCITIIIIIIVIIVIIIIIIFVIIIVAQKPLSHEPLISVSCFVNTSQTSKEFSSVFVRH